MNGYNHIAYAGALTELGTPEVLPASGGFILRRTIPGTDYADAIGPYPLFTCHDWGNLPKDLEALAGTAVALSLVTDPFGQFSPEHLAVCFPDVCVPYKEHFVVDLVNWQGMPPGKQHRQNLRRARDSVTVARCDNPMDSSADWIRLYQEFIRRRGIRGFAAFSAQSLARQLQVPGITMFRAFRNQDLVGISVWYQAGEQVYYHLCACSDEGNRVAAAYALLKAALDHYSSVASLATLGGGYGRGTGHEDGLAWFKRGWTATTKMTWFCGRILDQQTYSDLAQKSGSGANSYFPAYRDPHTR